VDGSAASGTTIAETGHGSDLNVDFIGRRALKLDGFFMSTNGADNEAALRYRREDREFAQSGEAAMEYLIGIVLALVVCACAALVGFDRDRVFYPTMVVVVAHYYILFAVIGNSTRALILESVIAAGFFVVAAAGFKKSLWLVVAGLAGHGVFDFFHQFFIQNRGVPLWWPGFCMSFDVFAGAFLAMLLMRHSGFPSKINAR
jgi:hypothetical protein